MDPLYCFKFDEDARCIIVMRIDNYEEGRQISNKEFYRYWIRNSVKYVYKSQLDHFMNNRIYTFDPDMNRAVKTMRSAIQARLTKAQDDVQRYMYALSDLDKDKNKDHKMKIYSGIQGE